MASKVTRKRKRDVCTSEEEDDVPSSVCETSSKVPRRENSYRIYIDGACKNNNRPVAERYAGYGIYVDNLVDAEPVDFGNVDVQHVNAHLRESANDDTDMGRIEDLRFVSETCVCKERTNNRAELMAAIRCLELLLAGRFGATKLSNVTIVNDSKLVFDTVTDYLPRLWRPNNYRKANGDRVSNEDLVRRLDKALLLMQRTGWNRIRWQRMNSHCKQPKDRASNEWCDWHGNDQADRLANLACAAQKNGLKSDSS